MFTFTGNSAGADSFISSYIYTQYRERPFAMKAALEYSCRIAGPCGNFQAFENVQPMSSVEEGGVGAVAEGETGEEYNQTVSMDQEEVFNQGIVEEEGVMEQGVYQEGMMQENLMQEDGMDQEVLMGGDGDEGVMDQGVLQQQMPEGQVMQQEQMQDSHMLQQQQMQEGQILQEQQMPEGQILQEQQMPEGQVIQDQQIEQGGMVEGVIQQEYETISTQFTET